MLNDIKDRQNVRELISKFYTKVRKNDAIGQYFKNISNWDEHIEKLTDFWESNLFFTGSYRGNPVEAHRNVDTAHNHALKEFHFGIWLNLWFQTIDENYKGEFAERAKHNARKMSTHLFLNIYRNRT